jgi:hypothetical protein
MIEHIIIGFKLFISIVIKDKPQWVSQAEHDLIEYEEEVRDQIDAKKEEYIEKGGILLEQQMADAKRRI